MIPRALGIPAYRDIHKELGCRAVLLALPHNIGQRALLGSRREQHLHNVNSNNSW